MFPPELLSDTEKFLELAKAKNIKVATAESCTGGLVAGCLTSVPGSADVVDRGFVTYSNEAKTDLLDVPKAMIDEHGAVSAEVARAMVTGAVKHAAANLAVSVTGIAGPTGDSDTKKIGLVYIGARLDPGDMVVERHDFGDIGRDNVRLETVRAAIALMRRLVLES